MEAKRAIDTSKMSREEWLEERRKSIGGSDAAAVIGMSRFWNARLWTG